MKKKTKKILQNRESLEKPKERKYNLENLTEAGKGRRKGSKNKFTSLKDSFVKAFEKIEYSKEDLYKWATQKNNKKFFYLMISKMLPNKTAVEIKDYRKLFDDELERRKRLIKNVSIEK